MKRTLLALRWLAAFLMLATSAAAQGVVRIVVDRSWTGANIRYSAVVFDRWVYVGYYDSRREMRLARISLTTHAIETVPVGSRFGGFDSHNEIVLFADAHGWLHITGNMHRDPLIYARLRLGDPPQNLERLNHMTGMNEDSVTYPRFYAISGGRIAFLYRYGKSGDGETRVKLFDGRRWRDGAGAALLGGRRAGKTSNAYPSNIVSGPDGRFHVAWHWRYSPDARSSSDIAYAWSRDFETWYDVDGRQLTLPVSQESTAIVERIPVNSGLIFSPVLSLDRDGNPLLSFQHYDEHGNTQAFVSRRAGNAWVTKQITSWSERWEFSGAGSIPQKVRVGAVAADPRGAYAIDLQHFKSGRCYLLLSVTFDPQSCGRPVAEPGAVVWPPPPPASAGFHNRATAATGLSGAPQHGVLLRWVVQEAEGDVKPSCTVERPLACNPPPQPIEILVAAPN